MKKPVKRISIIVLFLAIVYIGAAMWAVIILPEKLIKNKKDKREPYLLAYSFLDPISRQAIVKKLASLDARYDKWSLLEAMGTDAAPALFQMAEGQSNDSRQAKRSLLKVVPYLSEKEKKKYVHLYDDSYDLEKFGVAAVPVLLKKLKGPYPMGVYAWRPLMKISKESPEALINAVPDDPVLNQWLQDIKSIDLDKFNLPLALMIVLQMDRGEIPTSEETGSPYNFVAAESSWKYKNPDGLFIGMIESYDPKNVVGINSADYAEGFLEEGRYPKKGRNLHWYQNNHFSKATITDVTFKERPYGAMRGNIMFTLDFQTEPESGFILLSENPFPKQIWKRKYASLSDLKTVMDYVEKKVRDSFDETVIEKKLADLYRNLNLSIISSESGAEVMIADYPSGTVPVLKVPGF